MNTVIKLADANSYPELTAAHFVEIYFQKIVAGPFWDPPAGCQGVASGMFWQIQKLGAGPRGSAREAASGMFWQIQKLAAGPFWDHLRAARGLPAGCFGKFKNLLRDPAGCQGGCQRNILANTNICCGSFLVPLRVASGLPAACFLEFQ